MRKMMLLAMSLVLALGFGVSGAWGDVLNFPDNTLVEEWNHGIPLAGPIWSDVVGPAVPFATRNATYDTTSHVLTIFSNWGQNTTSFVNTIPPITFVTADLFLDFLNGGATTDAAIRLFGADVGRVFYNPTFDTSISVAGLRVVNIGGKFTTNLNAPGPPSFDVPVTATSPASADLVSVIWTTINQADAIFSVAIDLDGIAGLNPNNFGFLWGTSTCANDVITNTVPVTPSLLLLGSGLLGLGFMRRKRGKTLD